MKKTVLILMAFMVILNLVGCQNSTKPDDVVLYVNETPVYKEEVEMHLDLVKTRVISEIEEEYSLFYEDNNFWNQRFDNTTAGEFLMKCAIEQVVCWHIQFDLATKNELENCHQDYYEWQTECQKYREQLKDNNIGVADNLSFDTYMSGQLSNIRINLIEKFAGTLLKVSDDEITNYYENNKNSLIDDNGNKLLLENIKNDISYAILEDKYDEYIFSLTNDATIKYTENFNVNDFAF